MTLNLKLIQQQMTESIHMSDSSSLSSVRSQKQHGLPSPTMTFQLTIHFSLLCTETELMTISRSYSCIVPVIFRELDRSVAALQIYMFC